MIFPEYQYENTRRVMYEGGTCFVPVCEQCFQYVKADDIDMRPHGSGYFLTARWDI